MHQFIVRGVSLLSVLLEGVQQTPPDHEYTKNLNCALHMLSFIIVISFYVTGPVKLRHTILKMPFTLFFFAQDSVLFLFIRQLTLCLSYGYKTVCSVNELLL